ncbi:hypothetical protein MTR67_002329 [Solanum verrucosum]|uniref:Uncharacterized protein n=1 Tax=Solanum verrucosum TaxID=315347 RepID=A0AAF0PVZ9_SOLVR|nr:hypothetical protein MTR67_002329 [Solanum verrucosum]
MLVAVHAVFHISMLKKFMGDPSLIIPTENIGIKDNIYYVKMCNTSETSRIN